ncbi:hypothetical protein BGX38DRAFT_102826 [Terfezia claveryi]|nr:hypothetical protein BGX38DRAFT_102826 [Terfezia claveryi]
MRRKGKKRRLGDTEARKESGKEIQEGQGGEPSGGTLTAMDWGEEYISEAGQPGGVGASQIGLEASQPGGAGGSQLGGLEASQHAARELTEEEVRNLTREMVEGQAEGRGDENMGDENMDGEEKQRGEQKRTWKGVCELRSGLELVGAIRENAEVLRSIEQLEHGERTWRSRRDATLAKTIIVVNGDCIERGWCELGRGGTRGAGRGWRKKS